MSTMVQPAPTIAAQNQTEPINLYKLGMLFVVRCRYWTCRAGNDAADLALTPDRIDARQSAAKVEIAERRCSGGRPRPP